MTTTVWAKWVQKTISRYQEECDWNQSVLDSFHKYMPQVIAWLDGVKPMMHSSQLSTIEPLVALTKAVMALSLYDGDTKSELVNLLAMLHHSSQNDKFEHLTYSLKQRIVHHKGWQDVTPEDAHRLHNRYGMAWINVAPASVLSHLLRQGEMLKIWPEDIGQVLKNKGVSFDGFSKKEVTTIAKKSEKWAILLYDIYPQFHQEKCFTTYSVPLFLHYLKKDSPHIISLWDHLVLNRKIVMRRHASGKVHIFVNHGQKYPIHDALEKSAQLKDVPIINHWKSPTFSVLTEILFQEKECIDVGNINTLLLSNRVETSIEMDLHL